MMVFDGFWVGLVSNRSFTRQLRRSVLTFEAKREDQMIK